MSGFLWVEPSSLSESVAVLAEISDTVIYAGGTDLLPLMNYGLKEPKCCISLRRIEQLSQIQITDSEVRLGAIVTIAQLAGNERIVELFPALAEAAQLTASPQIRNVGTIGGNILQERRCKYFNRSYNWRRELRKCYLLGGDLCYQALKSNLCRALYYSDLATPLIAYHARLELYGPNGLESIALENLFHGDGTRRLNQETIVTSIVVPRLGPQTRSVFIKDSIRPSFDFPLSNVAVIKSIDKAVAADLSIVVGAMAPAPIRLKNTEREFALLDHDNVKKAVEAAWDELTAAHVMVPEVELIPAEKLRRAKGIVKKALFYVVYGEGGDNT